MRRELIKNFAMKIALKAIIFALIMFGVAAVSQAISPVVSNELALTQMQNSNEMYILMDTYNKIRPIVSVAYTGIILLFICTIARDTYKFVKNMNENEKEI